MYVLKSNTLHKAYAFILTLIVLFPFIIQTSHSLTNHGHQVFNKKGVKQVQKQGFNCSICDFQIEYNYIDFPTSFAVHNPLYINVDLKDYTQFNYTVNLNLKSSRAPPYFIA